MKKTIVLLLLTIGLTATSAFSQSRHYTSQSLGMGSGGTAYVSGFNSNFINPANLMLENQRANVEIGLFNFGLKAGGTLANVAVYNKYLTSNNIITSENVGTSNESGIRYDMLNEWFGESSANERELSTTVSIAPIGVSYRGKKQAFSLATRIRITEDLTINKGMAELLTYGLDSDKFSTRTPVGFSTNTISFAEISIGYSRELDFFEIPDIAFAEDIRLFAGIAPKYLYGIYTTSMDFNSFFSMQDNNIRHEFNYSLETIGTLSTQLQAYEEAYDLDNDAELGDYVDTGELTDDFSSPQATGLGMDIGVTAQMDVSSLAVPLFIKAPKRLTVSMSLTDLGSLNFDQDASSVFGEGDFTYTGAGNDDDLDSFFSNLSDSLQNDVYGQFNSDQTSGIEYSLPSMFNFGTSLQMGNLLLALDYGVGFNNNGLNSDRSVLNLGAQYKILGFLPIRVGTRVGGYSSATYSVGLGLDFNNLELSFGAATVSNSESYGSSLGAAWSGLVIRF
ncbi:MAG: DUF5723 family protein [Gracilimonas sp.]|nr:DUF5723 family protein [Gracilimonas sp.]